MTPCFKGTYLFQPAHHFGALHPLDFRVYIYIYTYTYIYIYIYMGFTLPSSVGIFPQFPKIPTCIVNSLLLKDRREAVVVDEAPFSARKTEQVTRLLGGSSLLVGD